ncbi:SusC/RagA family TonB-linked outer membrane protein [Chitinophaga cymbidii]|uniref:SusC/RagA family TonB-linked outer membrane protein n=1 Tax=Chitinophaga cymbidii TaxID=1096750 RepID=A0A512RTC7_9BACT|nr:TonB-dependent receptor [Chitinophaga cymbidii]GEP98945.1 SusC/RagA family TonB-linked outer membrane protein [Chitinophaga cymbidii]
MKRLYNNLCLLLAALALPLTITAAGLHRQPVTGKVLDAGDNTPLPGVSVQVKGTTRGTATLSDGSFSLDAAATDILVVSLMGYSRQEVPVNGQSNIIIHLQSAATGLNELVVVGYGTQKKKLLTGATVQVSSGDLVRNHTLGVEQALQGQAAGVQITSNSGQPGDAMKFNIRGIGTNGNSQPLFIVDGFPTEDISFLNPADIATIDILKDAASTAIYGTRAANGLVMITTKKGNSGGMRVTLDASYGWQNPAKKLDLLTGEQYGRIINEAAINSGKAPYYTLEQIQQLGRGTDWQEAVTNHDAPIQNYSLGLSGGNNTSIFASSLSYQAQDGVIGVRGNSKFSRITFRLNSEHRLYKDIFKLGQNLTYSRAEQSGIGTGNIYDNSIRGLLNTSPTFPVYDSAGNYGKSSLSAEEVNPVGIMDYTNNNKRITDRILGNLYLEANIFKYFRFRTDIGIDLSFNSDNAFTPVYELATNNTNPNSFATMGAYRNFTWNWENTLTYQQTFGKHDVTVLAGTTAKKFNGFTVSGRKEDLIISDFEHAIIDNGTNDLTQKTYGSRSVHILQSYFGRVNYSFDDKYILSATLRRDGSTRFGSNNRYGTFPAFSAGWIVTNEDFAKLGWLDHFKIRGGWGQNGNDRIGDFAYLATVSSAWRSYYFGNGANPAIPKSVGSSPDKIPNPDLRWEASQQTDIGFDATLFKSLNITFDWYNKTTKDWLVAPPIPDIVGTGSPYINGGKIVNKGIELALNYTRKFGELTIGLGGNISFNRNTVLEVPNQDGILHPEYNNVLSSNMDEYYLAQTGFPIGYFFGLKTAGIFQNQQEIESYRSKNGTQIQPSARPGDVRFVDLNDDGVIDRNDKTMVGNPNPQQTYGINLTADWRGFDLAVLLTGVGGNQVVDGTRSYDRFYNNYTTAVFDRWTGEGTSNRLPRVTLGDEPNGNWSKFSDLYVHNGSFMRVKSINFGYDFKKTIGKKLPVQQLRLYVSGLNLYTFTHYRGLDPEVGFGIDPWSSGTDLGYYPQPRTVLVGLNVKF